MSVYYSELSFSIDLIRDAYQTNDLALIKRKLKSDLAMKVTEEEIRTCITSTDNYEKKSQTITMRELFNEQRKYEPV